MLLVSVYTGNLDLIPPHPFGRDPKNSKSPTLNALYSRLTSRMLTWMKHIDIQIDRHTKWRSGRWTICVRCLRAIHTYRVIYMRTFVIAVCCPKNHSNSIHIFSMLTTANRPIRVSDEAQETADWSKSAIHRGNQYLFHRLDWPSRDGGLNVPLCLHRPLLPCCLQSWRCNCTNLFASWRRTLYRDDPCDATIDCRTWYE